MSAQQGDEVTGGAYGRPPLDRVLGALAAAGTDLRETGSGRWRGACPACGGDDRLTVNEDLNRRVWLKCWSATCSDTDILNVLGLVPTDLRAQEVAPRATWEAPAVTTVEPERVEFLVPQRVPLRAVTLVAGDPGVGKSMLTVLWAAELSRGELGPPGVTLLASAEDGVANVIRARLVAAGAREELIRYLVLRDPAGFERGIVLPDEHALLAEAVAVHQARLVVVDPVNAHLSTSTDSWKDHGVRAALAPLARLADERGCAVVAVMHLNKQKGGSPLYRIGGSIGYVGAARSVLGLGRDPGEDARSPRRLLGHLKSNWGPEAPTQAYTLKPALVWEDTLPTETRKLVYVEDLEDVPAAAAFGHGDRDERGADVEEAIAEALAGRPRKSREVKSEVAGELGVSTPTVERGASRMIRRGDLSVAESGFPRTTTWELRHRGDGQNDDPPDSGDSSGIKPITERDVTVMPLEREALESQILQSHHSDITGGDGADVTGQVAVPAGAGIIFLDSETSGLDSHVDRLVCVGFAADDSEPVVLRHPEQRKAIQSWLTLDADYVGHNLGFDMAFVEAAGYTLPPAARWHDTVITAHVAGERLPGQTRLRRLASALIEAGKLAGDTLEPELKLKAWLRHERRAARKEGRRLPALGDAPAHLLHPYLEADVVAARAVHEHYGAAVDGQAPVLALERRVLPAIYAAERRGVPLDLDAARELRDRSEAIVGDLRARLFELAGGPFNPNAARQVERALLERGVDLSAVPRTPKADMPQFTADTLGELHDDLARTLLEYRSEKKLSDYVAGLWRHAHGDRLYGSFRQVGAATGRMSSGSPNLQNIPKDDLRVRYCIRAGDGKRLVGADLDSVELRLLAAYAPGGALARAFSDGADLHQQTAEALGIERDQGKRINYAVVYGAGGPRIAQILGCDVDDGWDVLERWYATYPEVKRLKRRLEEQVRRRSYIETVGGRRHFFEEPNHMLLNYLIQGSAADLFKRSVAELHEAGVPIVLLVHDEVVAEVDEGRVDETAQRLEHALAREVSAPGVRIRNLVAEASAHQRWSDFKQEGWTP